MIDIAWAAPAFAQLEALPEALVVEFVRRVDLLATFPKMGVSLRSQYPALQNCRQLIINRSYRVVYEFEADTEIIYILAMQHCRQQLPTTRELRRGFAAEES